ncbi:MAG: hypothetical protein IT233_10655 [Bacteroidia bacterium]|nr:hypothetical protein [Bacteroidia bacterium]
MESKNNLIEIKPYTKKELAGVFGITPRCLYTWLKEIEMEVGPKKGKYYTPNQVRIIVKLIGGKGTMNPDE